MARTRYGSLEKRFCAYKRYGSENQVPEQNYPTIDVSELRPYDVGNNLVLGPVV